MEKNKDILGIDQAINDLYKIKETIKESKNKEKGFSDFLKDKLGKDYEYKNDDFKLTISTTTRETKDWNAWKTKVDEIFKNYGLDPVEVPNKTSEITSLNIKKISDKEKKEEPKNDLRTKETISKN